MHLNLWVRSTFSCAVPIGRPYCEFGVRLLLIGFPAVILQNLYNLGARKIFIVSVGPLGCIPSQLYQQKSPDGSCIEFLNSYVRGFNAAVRPLLRQLTSSLPGSIYVYGNAYDLVASYVANPAAVGTSDLPPRLLH